ncbi:hypothetical protein HGA64_00195 [Candidatus Falkowbacteria bacterium]|nr:hypothetical protein [Candidatus Falkowbacteria bacterium]
MEKKLARRLVYFVFFFCIILALVSVVHKQCPSLVICIVGFVIVAAIQILIVAYFLANIWMIKKMSGSILNSLKEDGFLKTLFIFFFGVPWFVFSLAKIFLPEDDEETA